MKIIKKTKYLIKAINVTQKYIVKKDLHFKYILHGFIIIPLMPFIYKIISLTLGWTILTFFRLTAPEKGSLISDIGHIIIEHTARFAEWIFLNAVYPATILYILLMIGVCIKAYRHGENSMKKILEMYTEIFMIFTLLYFLLSLHSPEQDPILIGIDHVGNSPDEWIENSFLYGKNFLNSVYFSISTMVTYNDGIMRPNWLIAKAVVSLQLILSFGMTVIVIGRFFAESDKTN